MSTIAYTIAAGVALGTVFAVAPTPVTNVELANPNSARLVRTADAAGSVSRFHTRTTIGTLRSSGYPVGATQANTVSKVDPGKERLMAKVNDLAAIRPDEFGLGSLAVDPSVLSDFRLLGHLARGITVVPTHGGSIVIEWSEGEREFTAQIDPNHQLFMCVDNVVTDELAEETGEFTPSALRQFIATGGWA